jgi:hypothetical protein
MAKFYVYVYVLAETCCESERKKRVIGDHTINISCVDGTTKITHFNNLVGCMIKMQGLMC